MRPPPVSWEGRAGRGGREGRVVPCLQVWRDGVPPGRQRGRVDPRHQYIVQTILSRATASCPLGGSGGKRYKSVAGLKRQVIMQCIQLSAFPSSVRVMTAFLSLSRHLTAIAATTVRKALPPGVTLRSLERNDRAETGTQRAPRTRRGAGLWRGRPDGGQVPWEQYLPWIALAFCVGEVEEHDTKTGTRHL